MTTTTELTSQDGIAILRLNRPEVLNAMNEPMVGEIEQALDLVTADDAIRALVLIGTGRAFCVGSDLKEGSNDAAGRIARMHRLILRLDAFPKVTVAAFNGLALGGGLELGMACIMRVAANTARLGLPEIKHSLMPAYGGTQLLPRLVGYARAAHMMLSGEMIEAARAEQIGLVNAVADDVLTAAVTMAQDCSRGGSTASREIRRALGEGWSLPLAQGLAIEAACAGRVAASEEARSGVAAFGAKH
ncbi:MULTISPECIES: enoyl-CoA hydratase/isomerase family protein [unclassified Sphingobium]|uniref:enoyl-CoA hydratase/isomerase family protein n=1 Tax=unclassified Sphingobium TaxID=2611147 RepID=UPI0035A698B5